MNEEWPASTLRSVADVRLSNVDKKFYAAETPVKLCNYMDVYANDYVTAAIEFMAASASKAEIERFGLMAGDVVITKDSETPDDIGVSAVIADQISQLVCGYHLAIIRPRNGEIDPVYLAKQLRSPSSIKYFAANASGSTRFGLSIGAIESLEIPLAPRPEQTKIGEILATVDRAIEQTEALIAKKQRIKTGLMQDLLTRGIDEQGNLRFEQTHEFKESPLGRIPLEWGVKSLQAVTDEDITYGIVQAGPNVENGVPYIRTGDMAGDSIDENQLLRTSYAIARSYQRSAVSSGDIVFALRATVGKVLPVTPALDGANLTQGTAKISPSSATDAIFLLWALRSSSVQSRIRLQQKGTTFMEITLGDLRLIELVLPLHKEEQVRIAAALASHEKDLRVQQLSLEKLRSLQKGLMQDLLSGKRRVTALVAEMEMATG